MFDDDMTGQALEGQQELGIEMIDAEQQAEEQATYEWQPFAEAEKPKPEGGKAPSLEQLAGRLQQFEAYIQAQAQENAQLRAQLQAINSGNKPQQQVEQRRTLMDSLSHLDDSSRKLMQPFMEAIEAHIEERVGNTEQGVYNQAVRDRQERLEAEISGAEADVARQYGRTWPGFREAIIRELQARPSQTVSAAAKSVRSQFDTFLAQGQFARRVQREAAPRLPQGYNPPSMRATRPAANWQEAGDINKMALEAMLKR